MMDVPSPDGLKIAEHFQDRMIVGCELDGLPFSNVQRPCSRGRPARRGLKARVSVEPARLPLNRAVIDAMGLVKLAADVNEVIAHLNGCIGDLR